MSDLLNAKIAEANDYREQAKEKWENSGPSEAVAYLQQAIEIWRDLCTRNRRRFLRELARDLEELANIYDSLPDHNAALRSNTEALKAWQEAVSTTPGRFDVQMAKSLTHLAGRHAKIVESSEAVPIYRQALSEWQKLAQKDPDKYSPAVAQCLFALGKALRRAHEPKSAMPLVEQALAVWRRSSAISKRERHRNLIKGLRLAYQIASLQGDRKRQRQLKNQIWSLRVSRLLQIFKMST